MRPARTRRAARGSTIIEVMIAASMLIIAAVGFAGTSRYASTATGVGHRRTVGALLRAGLIDRLHVTPRTALRTVAAASESVWVVDGCYDWTSQLLAGGRNDAWVEGFVCPEDTYYRTWINVTDNGTQPWAAATNTWQVALFVERVDPGCAPEQRESSAACISADLLLTD